VGLGQRLCYNNSNPLFKYTPSLQGDFSVRLTVTDADNGFLGMQTKVYHVVLIPLHDMEIQSLTPNPVQVNPGAKITVSVSVKDNGTYNENFNLSVAYGTPPAVFGSTGNQSAIAQGTVSLSLYSRYHRLRPRGL